MESGYKALKDGQRREYPIPNPNPEPDAGKNIHDGRYNLRCLNRQNPL